MKYRIILLIAGVILVSTGFALQAKGADDASPRIKFPHKPSAIEPETPDLPQVDPRIVDTLTTDTWYVIEAESEYIVLASPVGHVKISPDKGPIKAFGKFSDGNGGLEVRTYKSAFVYFVSAVATGQCEIIAVPIGATSEAEVVRQNLTVLGPRPPPGPIPPSPEPTPPSPEPTPPKPTPPKPTPPTPSVEHVRVVVIEDVLNRSPQAAIVLNALAGWPQFVVGGNEFRIYDKSTNEKLGKEALLVANAALVDLPAMVIYDRDTGEMLEILPLSKTFADLRSLIKGLTGG